MLLFFQPSHAGARDAYLEITSEPAGAKITVNGEELSRATPLYTTLPPGRYRIVAEKESYLAAMEEISLKIGDFRVLRLHLEKPALLELDTSPAGALVTIRRLEGDGETVRGRSPMREEMERGVYELLIEKYGYESLRERIEVTSEPIRRIYFLSRKEGESGDRTDDLAAPAGDKKTSGFAEPKPAKAAGEEKGSLSPEADMGRTSRPSSVKELPEDKTGEAIDIPDAASATAVTEDGLVKLHVAVNRLRLGRNEVLEMRVSFSGKMPGSLPELSEPTHNSFRLGEPSRTTRLIWTGGGYMPVKTVTYSLVPEEEGAFDVGEISFTYGGRLYATKPFRVIVTAHPGIPDKN